MIKSPSRSLPCRNQVQRADPRFRRISEQPFHVQIASDEEVGRNLQLLRVRRSANHDHRAARSHNLERQPDRLRA